MNPSTSPSMPVPSSVYVARQKDRVTQAHVDALVMAYQRGATVVITAINPEHALNALLLLVHANKALSDISKTQGVDADALVPLVYYAAKTHRGRAVVVTVFRLTSFTKVDPSLTQEEIEEIVAGECTNTWESWTRMPHDPDRGAAEGDTPPVQVMEVENGPAHTGIPDANEGPGEPGPAVDDAPPAP